MLSGIVDSVIGSMIVHGIGRMFRRRPIRVTCAMQGWEIAVTIRNRTSCDVVVHDVRLMFCKSYGWPQQDYGNGNNPELPAEIKASKNEIWKFPIDRISESLRNLYQPKSQTHPVSASRPIRAKCITGDERAHFSGIVSVPTDTAPYNPIPTPTDSQGKDNVAVSFETRRK